MNAIELEKLRFPIGEFVKPANITSKELQLWITDIAAFPSLVKELIANVSDEALNWPYRPNGWNTQELIHHCADSHMNSFIRFKLSLTEEKPIIKPYDEAMWATLSDVQGVDIRYSISILEGLHARWTILLASLTPQELSRVFIHPEHGKEFSVDENIGVYAWHCNHHLAHMKLALNSSGRYASIPS